VRLTTKSRYGTRLVLDIALHGKKSPVTLNDIAKRQGISLKYLEQLTIKLKKEGIIKSKRGPYGGYMLAKPADKISVGDIVRILEGTQSLTDCSENDEVCGVCTKAGDCITRWIWREVSQTLFDKLDSFKISTLC